MSVAIATAAAPGRVHRVARRPDAFALPSWEYASNADGTFGGRYDDPLGEYRVLYVSATRARPGDDGRVSGGRDAVSGSSQVLRVMMGA